MGSGEGASLIAKDLIDSEDPEHTLVLSRSCICRDIRGFSGVIFPSFNGSSNIFATVQSLDHKENIPIDKKGLLIMC